MTYMVLLFFIACSVSFYGGFCISTMLAEITFLKEVKKKRGNTDD